MTLPLFPEPPNRMNRDFFKETTIKDRGLLESKSCISWSWTWNWPRSKGRRAMQFSVHPKPPLDQSFIQARPQKGMSALWGRGGSFYRCSAEIGINPPERWREEGPPGRSGAPHRHMGAGRHICSIPCMIRLADNNSCSRPAPKTLY